MQRLNKKADFTTFKTCVVHFYHLDDYPVLAWSSGTCNLLGHMEDGEAESQATRRLFLFEINGNEKEK